MDPRLKNLDRLFNPRSVAFVGATETPNKWGYIIYNNLIAGGYQGKIYPVNPGRDSVLGLRAYPSLTDVPGEVDMAVFTVPAEAVLPAIDDCGKKGVKAAVVISAGFKEMGGERAGLEVRMVEKARANKVLLVGPNGQGVCCPRSELYPWIPPGFRPPAGEVAVVSQSGNVQTLLCGEVIKSGFGISRTVSSGNEADLTTADYVEYFSRDEETAVIVSYLEGSIDGRSFVKRISAAAKEKPVVIFKGGATDSGAVAARSHTGAMAVDGRLFEGACRQAGVIRCDRLDEAGIIASSFINRPLPRGKRVAIVTGGGGLGVVAADICVRMGLLVPELSADTLKKIGEYMPDWWVPGNPVDMVAGLRFGTRRPIIEILMRSNEVDAVILLRMGPPRVNRPGQEKEKEPPGDRTKVWKAMAQRQADLAAEAYDLMHENNVPLYMVSNLFHDTDLDVYSMLGKKKMAVYPTIDSACAAVAAMAEYSAFRGTARPGAD